MRLKNFLKDIKTIWQKGTLQRTGRIIYDVIWNVILFFLIVGFIGIFFVGGLGAGYFASLVKDEPVRSYESMEKDIYNYSETSKLYFADGIYLGDVRTDLHREYVPLEEISDVLIDAVIATEDNEFYEHNGVVPKAIIRALIQEVFNTPSKSGGSTLTQQLIKNQILTNEVSFDRKAKEILLALRLERFFDKDEILEAYLNIIPYGRDASGRNIAGIETAAQGVFGVHANELNLPQAAFLAGLPQSPSAYTPFTNSGSLKSSEGMQAGLNRMKTVLRRMLEADMITEQDYQEAINYNIVADFREPQDSPVETYPSLTFELQRRAQNILMEIVVERDGYTMEDIESDDNLKERYQELAIRELENGGYNIYSTINKEMYDAMREVAENYEFYGPDVIIKVKDPDTGEESERINRVRTGSVLIENQTGRIISFVSDREDTLEDQFNNATQAQRPAGSTAKPIIAYGPAIDMGLIQPGTPILDHQKTYHLPSGDYTPSNYSNVYYGMIPAREALARSHNMSAVDIYYPIFEGQAIEPYLRHMGLDSLLRDIHVLSLPVGGMTDGVGILESASAFSTFGNGGVRHEEYMIEKITTHDGEVIYEHQLESVQVFSEQAAYLTVDMMRDVLRNGTATYIPTQLKYRNVDWAGKTGTSNEYHDAWFIGLNPNVTMATWIGYEEPHDLRASCVGCSLSYSQRVNKLWADLINVASDINPELVAPEQRFERPEGIVQRSYCAISGMLPSELCERAGLVKTDLFSVEHVPTEVDDSLIEGSYVLVDGKAVPPAPNTPNEFIEGDGLMFNPEFLKRNGYDQLNNITELYPRLGPDREKWEAISAPSTDFMTDEISDDGEAPSAPSSLNESNQRLTWNEVSNQNVVGYRIYRAAHPEDDFQHIGSTTETSFSLSRNRGLYYVTAVNYFGRESEPSAEIIIGEFDDPDENDSGEDQRDRNEDAQETDVENIDHDEGNNGDMRDRGEETNDRRQDENDENNDNNDD